MRSTSATTTIASIMKATTTTKQAARTERFLEAWTSRRDGDELVEESEWVRERVCVCGGLWTRVAVAAANAEWVRETVCVCDASGARASLICATGAYGIFNLFFSSSSSLRINGCDPWETEPHPPLPFCFAAICSFGLLCFSVRSPAHRETPAYFREVNAWLLGLIKNCCNDFFLVQNHSNVAIVSCAATNKITPHDPWSAG